jgi:hypothetical protein
MSQMHYKAFAIYPKLLGFSPQAIKNGIFAVQ